MTEPKKQTDWQGIELEYRAGIKSLRTIGANFEISDAAIVKRAKRDGWTRDLGARVRAATEEKLRSLAVSEEVSIGKQVSEDAVVDAYANKQLKVIERQGQRIESLTALSDKLTEELLHATNNLELYEQLGELMHEPDEKGKDRRNEVYNKVINSGSRIASLRSLVETQKTLIGLQRQNVGLADNANGEADKPAEAPQVSDTEAARRIAFAFAKAMKKEPHEQPI